MRLTLMILAFLYLTYVSKADDEGPGPGAFTNCIAADAGERWNIVNGHTQPECFGLARKCTGNPAVQAWYYPTQVIIPTPYRECDQICIGSTC
ncbi:hypothetical protein V1280_007170 [Bradyrhizobium sp. AZCC 2230]